LNWIKLWKFAAWVGKDIYLGILSCLRIGVVLSQYGHGVYFLCVEWVGVYDVFRPSTFDSRGDGLRSTKAGGFEWESGLKSVCL